MSDAPLYWEERVALFEEEAIVALTCPHCGNDRQIGRQIASELTHYAIGCGACGLSPRVPVIDADPELTHD